MALGCQKWKPVVVILTVYFVMAVLNILFKKIVDQGSNHLVIVTYRLIVGAIFMLPIAYFSERKNSSKLTPSILLYVFFSALMGATLTQYLYLVGIHYTSAAYASAFTNMTPVFTFLLALPLRDISLWILRGKLQIFTVLFAGIFGSGFCYVGISWCVEQRRPVFTAAFSPFIQIFVMILDLAFFHERIFFGSVIGSILVVCGLYTLLWGKSNEAVGNMSKRPETAELNGIAEHQ